MSTMTQLLTKAETLPSQGFVAKLDGLWATEFEYDDLEADIRAIREESVQHLLEEMDEFFPTENEN